MNNLLSYCGLVDAKIRATDKDLPVRSNVLSIQILEYHTDLTYSVKYPSEHKAMCSLFLRN